MSLGDPAAPAGVVASAPDRPGHIAPAGELFDSSMQFVTDVGRVVVGAYEERRGETAEHDTFGIVRGRDDEQPVGSPQVVPQRVGPRHQLGLVVVVAAERLVRESPFAPERERLWHAVSPLQ